MLAKRKELADAQIQEAVKAKEEAETMKSEYEQGIRDARIKPMRSWRQLRRQLQFRVRSF